MSYIINNVKLVFPTEGDFTAYYLSMVPGQTPDALSGVGKYWSKVMRRGIEEWRQATTSSAIRGGRGVRFSPAFPPATRYL